LAAINNQLAQVKSQWEERTKTFAKTIEALVGTASEEY
jgi:hypothetical protein